MSRVPPPPINILTPKNIYHGFLLLLRMKLEGLFLNDRGTVTSGCVPEAEASRSEPSRFAVVAAVTLILARRARDVRTLCACPHACFLISTGHYSKWRHRTSPKLEIYLIPHWKSWFDGVKSVCMVRTSISILPIPPLNYQQRHLNFYYPWREARLPS